MNESKNTLPNRKRLRYNGYDYSTHGLYFVTVCTHNSENIFGTVFELSEFGKIADEELNKLPSRYENNVEITIYSIMPNHIHLIIFIKNENENSELNLSKIIGNYKAGASRRIHKINSDIEVWQKSFYDHIISNEREESNIWDYIQGNKTTFLSKNGIIDDSYESYLKVKDLFPD